MNARLPLTAILLGIAGLIPFILCGLAAIRVGTPDQLDRGAIALIGYGAVILSFLGGVHWGFVLQTPRTETGTATRWGASKWLALGVVPALIGWLALLAPLYRMTDIGIAVLIAGFLATVVVEQQMRRRELVPASYMALRWGLSIVVLMILVTVLTLRLIGATILF